MAIATSLLAAAGIVLLSLNAAPQGERVSRAPLRVVDSVDLKRYAGTWFEIARLPNKFQKACAGDVTAQYLERPDGRIDVINRCRTGEGKTKAAQGIARKAGDGKSPARLEVRFAPPVLSFLPMVWGDYWIIGLGPDYTWAVVGTPSREYLWILARGPALSDAAYGQAVEIANGNGFDVSRLTKTPQARR